MPHIVLDSLCSLPTDLIRMGGPLFHDRQAPPGEVDLRQIEVCHGRPAHPGFNQRIHDGAVAIRAVARAARALPRPIALAISRAPANREEEIGRIEQAAAVSARSTSRPVPRVRSLIAAMGWPNGKG